MEEGVTCDRLSAIGALETAAALETGREVEEASAVESWTSAAVSLERCIRVP